MRAESEHTGGGCDSSPSSATASRYGAIQDPLNQPVNWALLVGLMGCLSFWCAVVVGIVAAV